MMYVSDDRVAHLFYYQVYIPRLKKNTSLLEIRHFGIKISLPVFLPSELTLGFHA